MFERLGEIEQNGERFKSESEEPPVKDFGMGCLKFLSFSLKIIHSFFLFFITKLVSIIRLEV